MSEQRSAEELERELRNVRAAIWGFFALRAEGREAHVPPSSVDMAIAVYVDRYIRGVIEADELEIGVDRVLRDGGWVETGDDFVVQVGGVRRAPRPNWLRAAQDADIARRLS